MKNSRKNLLLAVLLLTFIAIIQCNAQVIKVKQTHITKTGFKVFVGDYVEFSKRPYQANFIHCSRTLKNSPKELKKLGSSFSEKRFKIEKLIVVAEKVYANFKENEYNFFVLFDEAFLSNEIYIVRK